ncbi:glycosyltransferase family 4 protein [Acuticoccus sp. M5D2P5]|uniref:glycosyltransferase family 4 protein n=1 Tax=Acuticoccus kalidii TaxID=2910977 RepID=UPI001F20D9A2|nr:glycosyltransferase family 4 protein [Acuticoccus kalidii]MCF3936071.1 glycosyltransferase family 4 protein [Acuticoccus kalidii]
MRRDGALSRSMRVVAVNRFYAPDESATAQLLADLSEALAEAGHDVVVITARLSYSAARDLPAHEERRGVAVRRVWSTRFGRARLAGRMLDYLTFYLFAVVTLLVTVRRGDIVIAKTDPPMISVGAWAVAWIRRARLVNWCQDLFPEVAGALGMTWANGIAGRGLTALRDRSLRGAAFNAVLNAPMRAHLLDAGVAPERIGVLPNWCDAAIAPVAAEANPLRKEWAAGATCVIGYSGNLGLAHMPDRVAALVEATRAVDGLRWLFVGGGAGHDRIRRLAETKAAVTRAPYQPRERLSLSLSAPDIHLVSLDPACEGLIMPSKLYGVLAAGRPVLFLGDPDGSVAREIETHGFGVVLAADRPAEWAARVAELVANLPDQGAAMAAAARARHIHYAPDRAIARWTSALESL